MTTGQLKHRITIQSNTPTVSASGAETPNWSTFVQRYAAIVPEAPREFFAARQINAEVELTLMCRGFAAITTSMRVLHSDGRVMDIVGVYGKHGKSPLLAEWIVIEAIEGKRKES